MGRVNGTKVDLSLSEDVGGDVQCRFDMDFPGAYQTMRIQIHYCRLQLEQRAEENRTYQVADVSK